MDKKSFEKEILFMASTSPEPVSEEKKKLHRENVYAHINTMFDDEKTEVDNGTQELAIFRTLKESFGKLFSVKPIMVGGLGLVLVSLFAAKLVSTRGLMLDVPPSMINAELVKHIDGISVGSRAIGGTGISPRRKAFITGVYRAGIDVNEDPTSQSVVDLVVGFSDVIGDKSLNTVDGARKYSEGMMSSVSSMVWHKEGYLLELVNLSSRLTAKDLNSQVMEDAIKFYSEESLVESGVDTNEGVPEVYAESREMLLNAGAVSSRDEVEAIIATINKMKVVIR